MLGIDLPLFWRALCEVALLGCTGFISVLLPFLAELVHVMFLRVAQDQVFACSPLTAQAGFLQLTFK